MTGRKNAGTLDAQVEAGQDNTGQGGLEQLDLFCGTAALTLSTTTTAPVAATRTVRDVAWAAAHEWEAHLADQRNAARAALAETAPRLYAPLGVRGYWARVIAFDTWVNEYGSFDCYALSHGWHREIAHHDPDAPTAGCRPATLCADLRCEHHRAGCSCVGDLLHRGTCLSCDWEGPAHAVESLAVEDAHDHAWPGWRDLPCVASPPERGTSAQQNQRTASWEANVNNLYPARLLRDGGPIRTMRNGSGTRHVPGRTGHGGYDLCAGVTPRPLGGRG